MHKLANIVDENHFYETVFNLNLNRFGNQLKKLIDFSYVSQINHLSLKLLNHKLNFTACGFFDLDMTTIYAVNNV